MSALLQLATAISGPSLEGRKIRNLPRQAIVELSVGMHCMKSRFMCRDWLSVLGIGISALCLGQWILSQIEIDNWLCCNACRYMYSLSSLYANSIPNLSKSELNSSSFPCFSRTDANCSTKRIVAG